LNQHSGLVQTDTLSHTPCNIHTDSGRAWAAGGVQTWYSTLYQNT